MLFLSTTPIKVSAPKAELVGKFTETVVVKKGIRILAF